MTDLEGRSLDEALARAMGWKISQQYGWGLWDTAEGGLAFVQSWHASLDALLRDIEPVCRERGMLRLSIEQAGENLWNAFAKMRSGMSQYEHGTGPTAATALARAFLAVLTRGRGEHEKARHC